MATNKGKERPVINFPSDSDDQNNEEVIIGIPPSKFKKGKDNHQQ